MKKHIEYLMVGFILFFGGAMVLAMIWFFISEYPALVTILAALVTVIFMYLVGKDYVKKHEQ